MANCNEVKFLALVVAQNEDKLKNDPALAVIVSLNVKFVIKVYVIVKLTAKSKDKSDTLKSTKLV